ncbi:MAG: dihydropteroate synthase [Clostridia bacterium]|nr:dihydropteroate synthase [Clostridia bacterium]MDE7329017.1 dihydropteroate synthase [Clostridia bacterium]
MKIGNRTFESGTHVMAIINLTPDSFYANSRATVDSILERVEKAIENGAEVIDVGGQSTRPSYTAISAQEEWLRLQKPIEMIKKHFDIPLSVDTFYPYVAEKALQSGADLINDVWGLQYQDNESMAQIIAKYDAAVCIMHNQNRIPLDENLWSDIFAFLDKSVELAKRAKIDENKILIDGGIGFGKSKQQNWTVLENYEKLGKYGYPLLLGTSRKSMFGGDINDRLAPTLDSTRLATKKGVLFVRVHDVKENYQAIRDCLAEEV